MVSQGKPDHKEANSGSAGFFRFRILCRTFILEGSIPHVTDNTASSNLESYQRHHQITALQPGHVDTLHTWPVFFGEQRFFLNKGNRKQCDQEQKQGSNREKVREKRRKSTAIPCQFSVIRCYSGEFGETFLWD